MTALKAEILRKPPTRAQDELRLVHPRFGEIYYTNQDLISFPQGLLGFEKKKRFLLYEREKDSPFQWMICADDAEVSFLLLDPKLFLKEYTPPISRRDLVELEIDHPQSLQMLVIVTLNRDTHQLTGNLSGPILVNHEKRIGKQLVLLDDKYSTKYRISNTE